MSAPRAPAGRTVGAEPERTALVLSGGGARGAYEAGVIQALFEGQGPARARPFEPRIFTGASVGAYNAALLAQEPRPDLAAAQRLVALWRERIANTLARCGNGVYRLRLNPLEALDPGCITRPLELSASYLRDFAAFGAYLFSYGAQFLTSTALPTVRAAESINLAALFSRQPLEQLILETLDLARLAASPNELAVVVSDWLHGNAMVFHKEEVVRRLGAAAVLASAAVPGLFEPVPINGTLGADGSVLMNTPLKPALVAGATELHVVFVDPALAEIPIPTLPYTVDTIYRLYAILAATQIKNDLQQAAAINEELLLFFRQGRALGRQLPTVRASRSRKSRLRGRPIEVIEKTYRPITVHVYRPDADVGLGTAFLNFSSSAIDRLIRQGYEDVVNHNCRQSQCVLPELLDESSEPRRRSE